MRKKIITGMTALAFVCSSLFLVGCCTKKEVQVSKSVKPETEMAKAEEATRAAKAAEAAEAQKAREEAERQAKLRESAMAQRLADEVQEFNSEDIYFDFDKSDLKPEAQAILKKKAAWLLKNPGYTVWIEGHCDERGTSEYNLALGERRAYAAQKFLKALGIKERRLRTISYGEESPADSRHNESAWAKNRRDSFKLIE